MAKRILLVLLATTALSGCARLASNLSYGSWLDTYGVPPRSVPAADPQAQARLQALDAQAEALRVKLATEPDRVKRIAYLRELRDIGDQQRPLARDLRFGRVPMTPPTQSPEAGG
jgi:hypothetical protein